MIEYANRPLARDGLMQCSGLCPPCASNRNQACREGFLGDWPGREPIICKRWGLGLSQELPESLLPVRASLGAAKSACNNNQGFSPSPAFFVVEAELLWKPEQPNKTCDESPRALRLLGFRLWWLLLQLLLKWQRSKAHEEGTFLYCLVNSKQLAAFTEMTKQHLNCKRVKKNQKFCYWGVWWGVTHRRKALPAESLQKGPYQV